jgi:hypothetical protein
MRGGQDGLVGTHPGIPLEKFGRYADALVELPVLTAVPGRDDAVSILDSRMSVIALQRWDCRRGHPGQTDGRGHGQDYDAFFIHESLFSSGFSSLESMPFTVTPWYRRPSGEVKAGRALQRTVWLKKGGK